MPEALSGARDRLRLALRNLPSVEADGLPAFCQGLSSRLGRPLLLCPVTGPLGGCSSWAAGTRNDYIYWDTSNDQARGQQFVLHEVAHVLHSRRTARALRRQWKALLPTLNAETVERVLSPLDVPPAEEQAADIFATLVLRQPVLPSVPSEEVPAVALLLDDISIEITG